MIRDKKEATVNRSRGRVCRVPCARDCGGSTVSINGRRGVCSSCRLRKQQERSRQQAERAAELRLAGPEIVAYQLKTEWRPGSISASGDGTFSEG